MSRLCIPYLYCGPWTQYTESLQYLYRQLAFSLLNSVLLINLSSFIWPANEISLTFKWAGLSLPQLLNISRGVIFLLSFLSVSCYHFWYRKVMSIQNGLSKKDVKGTVPQTRTQSLSIVDSGHPGLSGLWIPCTIHIWLWWPLCSDIFRSDTAL